jgi:hypothetical protein
MNKKYLYVILFALAVLAFAVLIYFVFIKDLIETATNDNANTNAAQNTNGGTLPTTNGTTGANINAVPSNTNQVITNTIAGNVNGQTISNIASGGLTSAKPVVDVLTTSTKLSTDGTLNYYDKNKGKFYRVDKNGQAVELTDQLFPNAEEISWSPAGDKVVVTFPDLSKIMYDFNAKKQATLPKEWVDIEFSESGAKLGFKNMAANEDDRWLQISNPDGTEVQSIEPIGDKGSDVAINWSPNNQVVATFRQSVNADQQEVLLIGLNGENFKSLLTEGRGFEAQWSPTGEQMIYSVYNGSTAYNPNLYIVDAQGDEIGANRMNLGIQTWSDKCTFSNSSPTLYCAVPGNLPDGSGLSRSLAAGTTDTIYAINTNTGAKSPVALPVSSSLKKYSISSLFLSGDGNLLYFQDATAGKVYTIQLK